MSVYQWNSVEELFEQLNSSGMRYVVLRNYEEMHKAKFFCNNHEDIDFLCENGYEFAKVLHAEAKMGKDDGIHYYIQIKDRNVPVDLRSVGDNYYDTRWCESMLENRVMADNGNWYVMLSKDYYYSLIYHIIVQKAFISLDYMGKLNEIAQKAGLPTQNSWKQHLKSLIKYMKHYGYYFVEPKDSSVYFQIQYMPLGRLCISYKVRRKIRANLNCYSTFIKEKIMKVLSRSGLDIKLKVYIKKGLVKSFDKKSGKFADLNRLSRIINKFYFEIIYDQIAQRRVFFYLDIYKEKVVELYENMPKTPGKNKDILVDNTIFTAWFQGTENAPRIVQRCIESLSKLGRPIVVITLENLSDYIELPAYILEKYKKGIISDTHLSDIVRITLLEQYGGVWIDSTVYIADNVPDYMINNFWAFKQSKQLKEVRMSGNWWLSAEHGNTIIKKMKSFLYVYWKYEVVLYDYYIFHIMWAKIIGESEKNTITWNRLITRYTDSTHLLVNKFCDEFNEVEWKYMKQISPVFKCTYKFGNNLNPNSYYSYLINGKLK